MSRSSNFIIHINSNIYGAGSNSHGQLGLGNTVDTSKNIFTQMVNNTGFTPKSISCGNNHTIVLMTNGTIYGVGNNYYRQLGTSTTSNINIYTLTEMVNNTGFTPKSISCG